MKRSPSALRAACLLTLATAAAACQAPGRESFSFYEERIDPILNVGCQRQTTGCHVDDGRGFALGNLDLSSYEALLRRSDTLEPYGPYSVGLLLLKGGDPTQVQVRTIDPPDPAQPDRRYVSVTTDIRHGGGEGAIAEGSEDYSKLKQWIDGGHAKNGTTPRFQAAASIGECQKGPGTLANVDLSAAPADQDSFTRFLGQVQPVLLARCAGSSCHGSRNADLYLSCGEDVAEQRWNYEVTLRYLNAQAVSSELLRRPMSNRAGGVFHEGGDVFQDPTEPDYKTLLGWAEDIASRRPDLLRFEPAADEAGLRFFANRVEPVLVRKGCMFLACHAPVMFHDLRLRGGAGGDFSEIAIRRNYEMSRLMLALESSDPNDSRLLAKNLCPADSGGRGVRHRGGALLEDFGGCADEATRAELARCANVDADSGDLNQIPAYCVLARWHAIERQQAIAAGELDASPGPRGLVWVTRPPGIGNATDFDSYRPGADLMWADATVAADGRTSLGTPRSLLGACNLGPSADVRGPALSWDASKLAFAARGSADRPLRIYQMNVDGSQCAPLAGLAADADQRDGILLHDFDPAYASDGRIVFASTRGYLDGDSGLRGPTRTPAALQPNANLYVFDGSAAVAVRQLTYLLDQELQPSLMRDGRVIFTAEKRAEDFHQLAGRRQNLDGGDYHPLFAQRPSIGFASATEIVELANRDFATVAAPLSAPDGGGTIVIVNRSIGPDQADRDPADRSYIHALTTPVPGAFGGATGIFRSPAPLPTGRLVASCDLAASELSAGPLHYGLCELDPAGGEAPRMLYSEPNRIAVEAVAVYPRVSERVYESRGDEPNGSTQVTPQQGQGAIVHYLDVPLLGSLMFTNTRTPRPIDERIGGLELLAPQPPPNSATDFGALGPDVVADEFGSFFQSFHSLGKVGLRPDGSLRVQLPAGTPLCLVLTDRQGAALSFPDGGPFTGVMRQREAMQFYPGEQAKQALPRAFFDGLCAGCHGSISGRELDVHVAIDVLTSASRTLASDELRDLR